MHVESDMEDPVTIVLELETLQHVRLHSKGARDCAKLQAWAGEAKFGCSEPREDWLDPSNSILYGEHPKNPANSKESSDSNELGAPQRVGYVFPLCQLDQFLEALQRVTDQIADVSEAKIRVDRLPTAVIQYLKDKDWIPETDWAVDLLNGVDKDWRSWPSEVLTFDALMDLLRTKAVRVWERDLLNVAVAAGAPEPVHWTCLGQGHQGKEDQKTVQKTQRARLDPDTVPEARIGLAQREAKRLCQAALHRAPDLSRLRNFQWEGISRVLELGGRCLIADEMGCGKSAQALGVVAAYNLWPVLIICPACMRLVWAEELETWLPALLQPRHVHIIHSSNDMLPPGSSPNSLGDTRVVIVSLAMARLLFQNLSQRQWRIAIVDESHCLRMINGKAGQATQAVLELLKPVPRVLLLSGTPSRSNYLDIFTQANLLRPGLLGESFHAFARDYDEPSLSFSGHLVPGRCRRSWQLALLLRDAMMVRRKKSEVLEDLPPKHRRIIRLALSARLSRSLSEAEASALTDFERCGLLKLVAAEKWLLEKLEVCVAEGQKAVVFAHHIRVLDRVSQMAANIDMIRIDGSTPPITRQSLIAKFMSKGGPSLAVIGVTACAVGVDLSAASLAIFVELPPDASWLCQAEDRLHRQGQQKAVDVLLLLAAGSPCRVKGRWTVAETAMAVTAEEQRWTQLRQRLREVTALHDATAATSATVSNYQQTLRPSLAGHADFSFEVSPHTSRLHVYSNGKPLGLTLRADGESQSMAGDSAQLEREAAAFRLDWKALSPYQQKLGRGVAHKAHEIRLRSAPSLSGSRIRFSQTSLADEAKTLPRCQVRVQYTQGRLGGHTLKFLQPMSSRDDSEPTLLCMECLKALDSHSIKPSSLDAALLGPDGETISHEASANETDLFCSGNCRARFFGKRNGTSLRRQLFDLERGVCQKCGVDCHDLWQTLLTSSPERRKKKLEELAPEIKSPSKVTEGSLWQADHVVPVWRGGGLCGLENLQTLCTACHRNKTKEEAKERKERKEEGKSRTRSPAKKPKKSPKKTQATSKTSKTSEGFESPAQRKRPTCGAPKLWPQGCLKGTQAETTKGWSQLKVGKRTIDLADDEQPKSPRKSLREQSDYTFRMHFQQQVLYILAWTHISVVAPKLSHREPSKSHPIRKSFEEDMSYGKGYGDYKGYGGWGKGGFYYPPWDGGKGMMSYNYGMMMPPMFAFKGKGKGKGKRSPQLNVDPAKKLWIGNIPEEANWKDLQALVDKAGKSRWVEIFRGKGKGTGAVVYNTADEAQAAKATLNGADLCGSSIVVDSWEKVQAVVVVVVVVVRKLEASTYSEMETRK
eukprot:s107_g40.t2